MGGHVLMECMSVVFYSKICLNGGHVFLEGMYYRTCSLRCLTFYWRVCFIGSHILHESMSYRWICLVGVHVVSVDMHY